MHAHRAYSVAPRKWQTPEVASIKIVAVSQGKQHMKFTLNRLVAAVAIAAAGHASAAPVDVPVGSTVHLGGPSISLVSGSGVLAYSTGSDFDGTPNTLGGLIGALNVGKIKVQGKGNVFINEEYVVDEVGQQVRTGTTARATVTNLLIDDSTGQFLTVTSTGGADHLGSRIAGVLTGGIATVTNLRFDLVNKLVFADLSGTKSAIGSNAAVNYNLPNTALWTIGSVSGPTALDPSVLALTGQALIDGMIADGFTVDQTGGVPVFTANNVISGLKVTETGFNFFRNSLGLLSTGSNALNAVNTDPEGWGTVTSSIVFAPVPEPSSYAMLGVGLLVVGGALRARRGA